MCGRVYFFLCAIVRERETLEEEGKRELRGTERESHVTGKKCENRRKKSHRERHSERERETDRQRLTEIERDRDTHRARERERERK